MEEIIKSGLRLLTVNDGYLLENDLNERSITHKMGEYYAFLFSGWDVDCEFNKNLKGPKKIDIDPAAFLNEMADFLDSEAQFRTNDPDYSFLREAHVENEDITRLGEELRNPENMIYDEELDLVAFILKKTNGKKITKPIFPDIIVHHRGTTDNLVVVEAKKTSNQSRSGRLYDLVKLHILTTDPKYNYQFAYFIDVPAGHTVDKLLEFDDRAYRFNSRIKIIEPHL